MPSAVPFQQGQIGLYNATEGNPGVYVSWDADTNFASTQSLIFRGVDNSNYRFPLIVSQYGINTSYRLDQPTGLCCSPRYTYLTTQSQFVVYSKRGDSYNTVYTTGIGTFGATPDNLVFFNYNNTDYLFFPKGANGESKIYTFGTAPVYQQAISYDAITGLSLGTAYTNSYFDLDKNNFYLTRGESVYACAYNDDFQIDVSNRGEIINSTNGIITGNTISYITVYDSSKIAVADNQNYIYEFLYDGDPNQGNASSQWSLNYKLSPSNQEWSTILYNHFGLIIAADSANDAINVIAPANVTTKTDTFGFNGVSYSIQSTSSTTNYEGYITNTVGYQGVGYMQFNNPTLIAEDSEYNIIVGDSNNRLTYIPTALDYIASVQAPLNEYIDASGNPACIYYVKQTNEDYSSILAIPPLTGDELLIKSSVLYELNALLRVPVYDEEPLFGYNRQTATLAYGDIVTDPAPQIRITCSSNNGQNSPMFVLSPYVGFYNSLDQSLSDPFDAPTNLVNNYPNGLFYRFTNEGKIYFLDQYGNPVSVQEYDTVLVTYYVKMFTNKQINNALYLALQAINAQPGLDKISSVGQCPFWYDQTLVSGAAYYLIRQLLVGLNQRERRLLVMDPESGSFDAVASLRETAKMYQEEFNELLKKLPLAVRPRLGTITTPAYSMPGSRARLFRELFKNGAS